MVLIVVLSVVHRSAMIDRVRRECIVEPSTIFSVTAGAGHLR